MLLDYWITLYVVRQDAHHLAFRWFRNVTGLRDCCRIDKRIRIYMYICICNIEFEYEICIICRICLMFCHSRQKFVCLCVCVIFPLWSLSPPPPPPPPRLLQTVKEVDHESKHGKSKHARVMDGAEDKRLDTLTDTTLLPEQPSDSRHTTSTTSTSTIAPIMSPLSDPTECSALSFKLKQVNWPLYAAIHAKECIAASLSRCSPAASIPTTTDKPQVLSLKVILSVVRRLLLTCWWIKLSTRFTRDSTHHMKC
jgi:hypothetical protein